jgi:hypothetical protein
VGLKLSKNLAMALAIALVVGSLWSAGKVTRQMQTTGTNNVTLMANGAKGAIEI